MIRLIYPFSFFVDKEPSVVSDPQKNFFPETIVKATADILIEYLGITAGRIFSIRIGRLGGAIEIQLLGDIGNYIQPKGSGVQIGNIFNIVIDGRRMRKAIR